MTHTKDTIRGITEDNLINILSDCLGDACPEKAFAVHGMFRLSSKGINREYDAETMAPYIARSVYVHMMKKDTDDQQPDSHYLGRGDTGEAFKEGLMVQLLYPENLVTHRWLSPTARSFARCGPMTTLQHTYAFGIYWDESPKECTVVIYHLGAVEQDLLSIGYVLEASSARYTPKIK